MSTNYYAQWRLTETPRITLRQHIGKSSNALGLSTISGLIFPTVDAWETFLRHNSDRVTILDEYGQEQDLEEFITTQLRATPEASLFQLAWLRAHHYTIHEKVPVRTRQGSGEYWVDEGRLFLDSDFS